MPSIKNLLPGSPETLGATVTDEGINFAVHSSGATRIELLLFDNITDRRPSQIIPLSAETNRTGDIWHIFVEGLPNRILYNIRADGPYEPDKTGTRFNPHKTLMTPTQRRSAAISTGTKGTHRVRQFRPRRRGPSPQTW